MCSIVPFGIVINVKTNFIHNKKQTKCMTNFFVVVVFKKDIEERVCLDLSGDEIKKGVLFKIVFFVVGR